MTSNAPPSGVAGFFGRVDGGNHPLLERRASTQRSGASSGSAAASSNDTVRFVGQHHVADRGDVAGDADAEAAEQLPGEAAGGHARGRFAGAGALEHVADVVVAVLDRAGQIGVARAAAA